MRSDVHRPPSRVVSLLAVLAMAMTLMVTGPTTSDAHEACTTPLPSALGNLADALAFANVFSAFLHTDSQDCSAKVGNVQATMDREFNNNKPDSFAPCIDGMAAELFPCDGVDLRSQVTMTELGLGQGDVRAEVNDIWGWTDTSAKGKQKNSDYAIVGSVEGTVFVNITDDKRPVVLGMLPTASTAGGDIWRDIKVYEDHAYIVSEHTNHGVQVFDLTRLRGLDGDASRRFEADARYTGIGSSHNIHINEETGFAYALGSGDFSSQPQPFSVTVGGAEFLASAALFGPRPTQEGLSAPIVDSGSIGCTVDSLPDLTGTIALVDRGACNFSLKVANAQDQGALGVVIISTSEGYINMSGGDRADEVTIPSVFVPLSVGTALRAALAADDAGTISAFDPAPVCGNGLHMIDISDPKNPTYAGCEDLTDYVHDTQCVVYEGPDANYQGREICFNSNGISGSFDPELNKFSIVDVTDKSNPVVLSRVSYEGSVYSHQGWLTEDQGFFLFGDELDEVGFGVNTTTRVWDVSDLTNPFVTSLFESTTAAIDHNIYTEGDVAYASNYEAGLRVYDASDPANGLSEIGFFDMYPESDNPTFDGGSWSNFTNFKQPHILVASSVDRGLFVLKFNPED